MVAGSGEGVTEWNMVGGTVDVGDGGVVVGLSVNIGVAVSLVRQDSSKMAGHNTPMIKKRLFFFSLNCFLILYLWKIY